MKQPSAEELRNQLRPLLKTLRDSLQNCKPLYVFHTEGDIPVESPLHKIICFDLCAREGSSGYCRNVLPGPGSITYFGSRTDLEAAYERFLTVAPKICEFFDWFSAENSEAEKTKSPQQSPENIAIVAAMTVFEAISFARLWQPESMIIPEIVSGSILYHDEPPGRVSTPDGRELYFQPNNFTQEYTEAWRLIRGELPKKPVVVHMLKTPIIQAAAIMAKLALDHVDSADAQAAMNSVTPAPKLRVKPLASRLVLGETGENPTIDGKEKRCLTTSQYRVVKAIVEAMNKGLDRLTSPELDRKSKVTDARKILVDLAENDDDWKSIIKFPEGVKGKGYGIS
jgi:hypothetical protein